MNQYTKTRSGLEIPPSEFLELIDAKISSTDFKKNGANAFVFLRQSIPLGLYGLYLKILSDFLNLYIDKYGDSWRPFPRLEMRSYLLELQRQDNLESNSNSVKKCGLAFALFGMLFDEGYLVRKDEDLLVLDQFVNAFLDNEK